MTAIIIRVSGMIGISFCCHYFNSINGIPEFIGRWYLFVYIKVES
jgi:hypothetical protein